MVLSESMQFNQNTSDNLNPADSTIPILKKSDETMRLEEGATVISTETIGHSWIVGSSTNGIVGANTNTQDGQQQVVGGAGRIYTLQRVVSPNNTYREHFRDTTFKDSPCTANWDTTNFRIAMSTSSNHSTAYNTIATFSTIFKNLQTVSKATLNCTEVKWNSNDSITYFLSADGGNNWEQITKGTEYTFTNTGTDLRVKVVMFGNGGTDTYIQDVQVNYVL